MKIKLLDDLHFEHWRDRDTFINKLSTDDCDVLVLAGDIDDSAYLAQSLDMFCRNFPQVVYVTGNHEHYHTFRGALDQIVSEATERNKNLHWLREGKYTTVIDGITFHGDTGWFRQDPLNTLHEYRMNDFRVIPDLRKWVYEAQEKFQKHLEDNLREGDIVVTHHMPSDLTVHDLYKNSSLNRFFVCDYTDLILDRKPAYWLFGHTHIPVDIEVGDTRLISNPRAYPGEFAEQLYDPDLIIEA